ncbi:MAG TPA: beta-galactosidase, partial [Verrucomicrobiae bacterium]|nr:beta-galactosidase [Verrucomicrobiae bacterium]
CLKFSSIVTDWDKFVTGWARKGRQEGALVRDYCLDDPQWRQASREQMQRITRLNLAHEPVAYDIRDELSTTISANPFDYDFNPVTLAKFRDWLKTQYRNLAALNEEWETRFAEWSEVRPFTTDQIKHRMATGEAVPRGKPDWQALQQLKFSPATARQSPTRWNFAPWADFRTYMDISLAGALDDLRQAAHALDPRTPVGIEGTQMPGAFGGYDLERLANALDWVEPYDIGNAREIFGSFMPGKPLMTTIGEQDANHAARRLWHLLLEGDRGCLVWWSEDCINWSSDDYALTPRAKALRPVLREMTSPAARLLLRAERVSDPIYIHYSQPSIQADWLLESTGDGSTWLRRFSSFEAEHNRMLRVRNAWLKLFQDLGYSPRFITSQQLDRLAKSGSNDGVLVLPQAIALSARDVEAVQHFLHPYFPGVKRTVFADGTPGAFDEHCKLRATNALERLFPTSLSSEASYAWQMRTGPRRAGEPTRDTRTRDIAQYGTERAQVAPSSAWLDWAREQMD